MKHSLLSALHGTHACRTRAHPTALPPAPPERSQVTWRAIEALLAATAAGDYLTMARALVTIGAADGEVDMQVGPPGRGVGEGGSRGGMCPCFLLLRWGQGPMPQHTAQHSPSVLPRTAPSPALPHRLLPPTCRSCL